MSVIILVLVLMDCGYEYDFLLYIYVCGELLLKMTTIRPLSQKSKNKTTIRSIFTFMNPKFHIKDFDDFMNYPHKSKRNDQ